MDNTESSLSKIAEDYVPPVMPIKEVVREYAVELTKNDLLLIHSLEDVLESGVEKVMLKINPKTGFVTIDENCYKSIDCSCVRVKKISDKGYFDSKSEAKAHIEGSSWHFPCPDYKYSNIKRNLEKAICAILRIQDVEVKSFNTGIVSYDGDDAQVKNEKGN